MGYELMTKELFFLDIRLCLISFYTGYELQFRQQVNYISKYMNPEGERIGYRTPSGFKRKEILCVRRCPMLYKVFRLSGHKQNLNGFTTSLLLPH